MYIYISVDKNPNFCVSLKSCDLSVLILEFFCLLIARDNSQSKKKTEKKKKREKNSHVL